MIDNESKIHTILEMMKRANDSVSFNSKEPIKNLKQQLEEFILDTKKEKHKQYMESIIKHLPEEPSNKKYKAPTIPVKELDEAYKDVIEEVFPPISKISTLQQWIEDGKILIEIEIDSADDYVSELEEQIDEYQDEIQILTERIMELQNSSDVLEDERRSEMDRISNLEMLLDTVSL